MSSGFPFRISAFVLAVCAQALVSSFAAWTQAYNPAASALAANREISTSSGIVISKRVDEVNLAFTVTDKKGRFIGDLDANDFQVLDNHTPPEELRFFQQQTDLPLRVALLIDASDSIKHRFQFEQNAASTFLKDILRPGKDKAFVISFDGRVHQVHDFSDDVHTLARAVKSIQAGGNTALYDAVILACNKLRHDREPQITRRAIILITDGMDTASRAFLHDAQEAAARAEVLLFALSTNDLIADSYPKGEAVLDLLTGPTGGYILPARDEGQLSKAFRQIEKALRNQYALGYQPANFNPDGRYRPVEVIPIKRGLKVQCRKGYFARALDALKR
jgi:Ca-activated chloride channel family protein